MQEIHHLGWPFLTRNFPKEVLTAFFSSYLPQSRHQNVLSGASVSAFQKINDDEDKRMTSRLQILASETESIEIRLVRI